MIVKLLIYKILQLFAFMLIGFVLAKTKLVRPSDSTALSKLCLYLFMPSAVINAFDFNKSSQIINGFLLAFFASVIIHIVYYLLDVPYKKLISESPVERASVMYSNAGNIVIPIVSFVLGEEWVVFSAAYLSVQQFFLWSHGIGLFSSDKKFRIKKILLNVNIISVILGIALMFTGIRLPTFVKGITGSLADILGIVGMLITGILAANINFKSILKDIRMYRVTLFRIIIYPLITLIILKLMSKLPITDSHSILLITFLASVSPAAATITQFAQITNEDEKLATSINIFSTLLCIISMPLFVMLYEL